VVVGSRRGERQKSEGGMKWGHGGRCAMRGEFWSGGTRRSHWQWTPVTRLLTAPVTNREGSYGFFFWSKPKEW
jgi:hypothetical protein